MSGYIFPLIVYPYVSRVLGVANIGACNFVDSIVEYFTIISMMGMNTVGIREIAKCKGDRAKLDVTFSELFSLNTTTTLFAIICLIIATLFIPKLMPYKELLYIGIGKLFFNYMLINWFFQGLENFKYIAARTIFIKILFVISVFIFVKDNTDFKIYYFLVCLTWAGNGIINFVYAKKFVSFHFTFKIQKKFIKSFFMLGFYWIMNSMYTTFNVAFLGFSTNDTEVGYYTTANKLLLIIMALFTTFTSVMVPRISNVLSSHSPNNINEAKKLIEKGINALLLLGFPLIFFVIPYSQEIIYIMSGHGYEGAIIPLQIMTPLFFLIGYDQIIVLQTLLPLGKDSVILRISFCAALIGIIFNVILVPRYGSIGCSFVLLLAEITVLTLSQLAVRKSIGLTFPIMAVSKHFICFIPVLVICYMLKKAININIAAMLLSFIITLVYILAIGCFFIRNKELIKLIKNKSKLHTHYNK